MTAPWLYQHNVVDIESVSDLHRPGRSDWTPAITVRLDKCDSLFEPLATSCPRLHRWELGTRPRMEVFFFGIAPLSSSLIDAYRAIILPCRYLEMRGTALGSFDWSGLTALT